MGELSVWENTCNINEFHTGLHSISLAYKEYKYQRIMLYKVNKHSIVRTLIQQATNVSEKITKTKERKLKESFVTKILVNDALTSLNI